MIPLRDINPTSKRPYVTWALIAVNVAVFGYLVYLGPDAALVMEQFGMIPAAIPGGGVGHAATRTFASLFLHAGWLHLLSNMWFLYVFGDNVEDALGRTRYVAFFLFAGVVAAATHGLVEQESMVPMVGASGAIGGVLAGYVWLYPRARVLTLLPAILFFFVEVPAFVFVFIWFGFQLIRAYMSLGELGDAGVAWWAHIGGFVAGIALMPAFGKRRDVAIDAYENDESRDVDDLTRW